METAGSGRPERGQVGPNTRAQRPHPDVEFVLPVLGLSGLGITGVGRRAPGVRLRLRLRLRGPGRVGGNFTAVRCGGVGPACSRVDFSQVDAGSVAPEQDVAVRLRRTVADCAGAMGRQCAPPAFPAVVDGRRIAHEAAPRRITVANSTATQGCTAPRATSRQGPRSGVSQTCGSSRSPGRWIRASASALARRWAASVASGAVPAAIILYLPAVDDLLHCVVNRLQHCVAGVAGEGQSCARLVPGTGGVVRRKWK